MFTKVGVETKWRLLILATWATWSKRSSSIPKPPCPRNVDDAASSQSKLGTIDYKMKNTELLFWQAYILHGYGWFQTQKKPLLSDSICIRCGAEGRTRTLNLTSWYKIINIKHHYLIPTQIPTRKITGFRHRTRTIRSWLKYRALLLVIFLDRLHCIKWYSHHRDRTNPDKSIFS